MKMSRDGYQWAETTAARMMAAALEHAKKERGLSVRQLAKNLGYKQAVVLSHMANGKSPIPIDRSEDLADELQLDKAGFLRAVVEQRHPEVSWNLLTSNHSKEAKSDLAEQLESILGASLAQLNSEQRRIMREVVCDPTPARRWLTVHELPDYLKFRTGKVRLDKINKIVAELEDEERQREQDTDN